ncbi:hypothetical protein [Aureimonas pseudogalii]|uniref:hypothetical protein n=1 Tax=Aureimonas pseudogalii TaxID=1744844 RepID=UPI001AED5B97|nr:hypothetical protein [Aureimonas pseudogalii]
MASTWHGKGGAHWTCVQKGAVAVSSWVRSRVSFLMPPGRRQRANAFPTSFSLVLRNELKETGVTVSCRMSGPIEAEFFQRGDLLGSDVGKAKKDDAARVAQDGFDAMTNAEGDVVWVGGTRCRPLRRTSRLRASTPSPAEPD